VQPEQEQPHDRSGGPAAPPVVFLVCVRFARGDVVDIRQRLVHGIDVVEAERTACVLQRDRSTWLVGILLLRLGTATLRLGVRSKISTAIWRDARRGAGIELPRPAKGTGSAWRKAARPRTREAARPGTTGPAILASSRFADGQWPSVEHLTVETLNRLLGVGAIEKLDKRKAARTTSLAVYREHDLGGWCNSAEIRTQIRFGRAVREVTNEQTDGQSTLS
jgi:hypothetical protein